MRRRRPAHLRPARWALAQPVAFVAVGLALGLVASSCADDDDDAGPASTPGTDATSDRPGPSEGGDDPADVGDLELISALQSFDACDDFLGWVRAEASERVGPYGLDGGPIAYGGEILTDSGRAGGDELASEVSSPVATDGQSAPGAPGDFSTTNVQEAGVDEPDIVKTDGDRIVALAGGDVQVLRLVDREPVVVGTLDLPSDEYATGLLLEGDRLLVLSSGSATSGSGAWSEVAVLHLVDLTDPADPTITDTLRIDGGVVSARLVDGTVRVVLRSSPVGIDWVYPEGSGLQSERDATAANRALVEASTIENWVPYVVHEVDGQVVDEGPLLDCGDVRHPAEFAGFGMLGVLTLDLTDPAAGLGVVDATGVLAGAETVYASTASLYVATRTWVDPEQWDADTPVTTELHRFDISDPSTVTYAASGQVDGYVLNQFALSELDGRLRVATTSADPWGFGSDESESSVTVLEEQDGELTVVGQVGDLGRGERIYSVRFVGDVGYVVTFRQTDPLYVIDLSDPTAPVEVGELELLGYSAYLHPVGDDLLIGVGQDASEQGRVQGTQVSLFDVSDPANPVRVSNYVAPDAYSEAEYDHHAFLYWEATGLTVLPLTAYAYDEQTGEDQTFLGALALGFAPGGVVELGRLTHLDEDADFIDYAQGIRRSLVIGDVLVTVSDTSVETHDLATVADLGHVDL
jgi:hypothetical protein